MNNSPQTTRLRLDQSRRWRGGDRRPVEKYMRRYPELGKDPETLLDLIYNEVMLRQECGDQPDLPEYLGRFPALKCELEKQFAVHEALEDWPFAESANRPKASVGAVVAASADDWVGRSFDDFRIHRRLGGGAMGQVYLAEQLSLRRPVALKILRGDLAVHPAYLQRFQTEAAAAARAAHANIVQVHASGVVDGLPYMVLEYVEGCALSEYLARNGPLPLSLAMSVLSQVGAALQRAGELGIVHRDIKPENILMNPQGHVKVTDFGLCRWDGEELVRKLTKIGTPLGTPLYMSPEQFQGLRADVRSDLYSFGATAYHLLAGRPPFLGRTFTQIARQHLKETPTPLETIRPELPAPLCRIAHKMLAKVPADRYPSASAFLQELALVSCVEKQSPACVPCSVAPGAPIGIGSVATTEVAAVQPPVRRRKSFRRSYLAGLFVLLAALGGVGVWWVHPWNKDSVATEIPFGEAPAAEPFDNPMPAAGTNPLPQPPPQKTETGVPAPKEGNHGGHGHHQKGKRQS